MSTPDEQRGLVRDQTARPKSEPDGLWERVEGLVPLDRALSDLRAHHLQLLAADRRRRAGADVPESVLLEERAALVRHLMADAVLQRVRRAADGPIVLFKGPEAAEHYPAPGLRPFVDVDVLVPDPEQTHRTLLAAGFVAFGEEEDYYDGLHHVQPLRWPGLPLSVELHRHPNWVDWVAPPPAEEFFEHTVVARVGVDGISALEPMRHALVLAVNSWSDEPLRRVLDLVDIAAVLGPLDHREVQSLADRWDVGGVWRVTTRALDHMLYGARRPASMRTWARSTAAVRDVTVAESHLRRVLSLFWALPPRRALAAFPRVLVRELGPTENETWRSKLGRMRAAVRNAFNPRSQHDEGLGERAHQLRRLRRRDSTNGRISSHR